MLNALIRVLRLEGIGEGPDSCRGNVTEQLSQMNGITRNAVGRFTGYGSPVMPRIDNILFSTARRRAAKCLPEYQRQLRELSESPTIPLLHKLWSEILEHRFKSPRYHAKVGTFQLDAVFSKDPNRALWIIEQMPFAVEEDEVEIVKQVLTSVKAATPEGTVDQQQHETVPCWSFIKRARETIDSLNFDLRMQRELDRRLLEEFERDSQIHRMRAYYLMCTKLIDQEDRTLKLLASDED